MTFAVENAFALAILGEHNPETTTTKDLILRTDLAFWRVSSRLLEGNTSLPNADADIFEEVFTLPMLGKRATSGLDWNTLVATVLEVYLSIRERLIRGECILPSPQSTMRASRLDPSVSILFGTGPTFPAAESDVGEFPDNILNGEYEEYDEDDRKAGLPNSDPINKGKRPREEDDSSPSPKTKKRARKDKGKGV